MTHYIRNAIKKFDKLTGDQLYEILVMAANELETFSEVLTSVVKGILVCDRRHTLIMTNSHAERLLQIHPWAEGAEVVWALVPDSEIAGFLQETLNAGYRIDDREFLISLTGAEHSKGAERLLSVSVLPLVNSGRVTGSLITVEDITEKRLQEVRLRQTEKLASLTTVAAGMAHEIKNPLGSMSIHVQLIQKLLNSAADMSGGRQTDVPDSVSVPYTKFNRHITTINEEIQRLNRIVVDFLFAVRPIEIYPVKSDINRLIKEVIKFVHYELKNANIKYKLRLKRHIPAVKIDKRYIKQALLNLIKNAIEAMSDSGGLLTINTEADDQQVTICVRDDGPGIPEAEASRIFEPYFTTKVKGSGLGLTLVFKIVREHSGDISVSSRPGEGVCFTIKLPLAQEEKLLLGYGDSV
jgi:signal transduction histidine kinase